MTNYRKTTMKLLITVLALSLVAAAPSTERPTMIEVTEPGILIVAAHDRSQIPVPTVDGGTLVVSGQRQENAPRIVLAIHVTGPGTVTVNWENPPNAVGHAFYATSLVPTSGPDGGGGWVRDGVVLFPEGSGQLLTAWLGRGGISGHGDEVASIGLGRMAQVLVLSDSAPTATITEGPHWTGVAVPLG